MSEFSERAIKHLTRYKVDELRIHQPGIFRYRGADLEKAHILPLEKQDHNLLPLVRPFFRTLADTAGKKLKWHRYFSHLNSSQALAINLFQPFLISSGRLTMLAKVLQLRLPFGRIGFEHVPDASERTNVDFFAEGENGSLLVEVKFTEDTFGKAKNDSAHRVKYRKLYRDRLKNIASFDGNEQLEFFAAYQFFRNAIYAGLKDNRPTRVWFLVPHGNSSIKLAAKVFSARLNREIAPHIQTVDLEDVLQRIEKVIPGDAGLVSHFAEFRRKYVVPG